MASIPFRNTAAAYAIAALPLITPVPIQDVQLFDYAVAHKTVNASYGLTANADDTYIIGKDPYTSDQQRSRDDRLVSDEGRKSSVTKSLDKKGTETNWISASTNACKIGWNVGDIQYLNIPERGISGPFKITSIKHILPQKKPESDPGDGYEWKPVTGLFIHHNDQVHNISFDDNETFGVTAPHPIFSTTYNDWRLAGELAVGEKVLTYRGEATVTKTEKKCGSEAVYNLEVKDLHNFLVGVVGVVVHNFCNKWISKLSRDWLNKGAHFNVPLKKGSIEITIVPDNNGGYLLKKWPKNALESDFLEGKAYIEAALQSKDFQTKLLDRVEAAIGYATENGSGKAAEFNFLKQALKNSFGL